MAEGFVKLIYSLTHIFMKYFFNLLFRRKAWAYLTLTGFSALVFFSSFIVAPLKRAEAAYVLQENENTPQHSTDRHSLAELVILSNLFASQNPEPKDTSTSGRSGGITQHNTSSERQPGSSPNQPGKTPGQTGETRQPGQTRETPSSATPGGTGGTSTPSTQPTQPGSGGTSERRSPDQGTSDRGTSSPSSPKGTTNTPSTKTDTMTDPNLQALILLDRLLDEREGGTTIVVERGDTLSKIAQQYLGDASRYTEIARLNNLANPNVIYPGQRLQLPSERTAERREKDLAKLIILQNLFSPAATSGTSNGTSKCSGNANITDLERLIILDRLFND